MTNRILKTTAPRGSSLPRGANPVSVAPRPQNNRLSLKSCSQVVNPPRRNGRVDSSPEWAGCHGYTDLPAPGSASSELSARYRYSLGDKGETSAGMKRIAASNVAWGFVVVQGLEQGRKASGQPRLITLGESMKLDLFGPEIDENELEMKWKVYDVVKKDKNVISFITEPIGWTPPEQDGSLPWE